MINFNFEMIRGLNLLIGGSWGLAFDGVRGW